MIGICNIVSGAVVLLLAEIAAAMTYFLIRTSPLKQKAFIAPHCDRGWVLTPKVGINSVEPIRAHDVVYRTDAQFRLVVRRSNAPGNVMGWLVSEDPV